MQVKNKDISSIIVIITLISIMLTACNKESETPTAPVYPMAIPVQVAPGMLYHNNGDTDLSPYYVDSYQLLRETIWDSFVANPGDDSAYCFVGQMGLVSASTNMAGDEWSWGIEYQGYSCQFQYTLPSKEGYSGASLFLYLARADYYFPDEEGICSMPSLS